jgi:hypothetical protein
MANEEYMTPLDLSGDAAPEDGVEDGLEVEVVDDTPARDQNRKPLPEDVTKSLEEDSDVEEYSSKVKQRIDQMKKAWHDERRAKESALRERDEATRIAQAAFHDRMAYQKRLQDGETWAIDQSKQRSTLQLDNAKRAYREAYEAGDSEKLVDAQQMLNSAMSDFERTNQYRPQYVQSTLQPQQNEVYSQPQAEPEYSAPEPDSRTKEWGDQNTWFGEDKELTSFALGVHQTLVDEGVSPNTSDYFERIDARMRQVFPDKFGGRRRQHSTVVAPVGRSPKGRRVVLTQTQVALAKRLGITPEAYARELVKQQEM